MSAAGRRSGLNMRAGRCAGRVTGKKGYSGMTDLLDLRKLADAVDQECRTRGIARVIMDRVFSGARHDEMILDVKTDRPRTSRYSTSHCGSKRRAAPTTTTVTARTVSDGSKGGLRQRFRARRWRGEGTVAARRRRASYAAHARRAGAAHDERSYTADGNAARDTGAAARKRAYARTAGSAGIWGRRYGRGAGAA